MYVKDALKIHDATLCSFVHKGNSIMTFSQSWQYLFFHTMKHLWELFFFRQTLECTYLIQYLLNLIQNQYIKLSSYTFFSCVIKSHLMPAPKMVTGGSCYSLLMTCSCMCADINGTPVLMFIATGLSLTYILIFMVIFISIFLNFLECPPKPVRQKESNAWGPLCPCSSYLPQNFRVSTFEEKVVQDLATLECWSHSSGLLWITLLISQIILGNKPSALPLSGVWNTIGKED